MAALDGRIGRIRFKNGAELRVIPSADEQYAERAFSALDRSLGHVKQLYEGQLDGYALIVWDKDGNFNTFRHAAGRGIVGKNTMPVFVAEALRRDNCEDDFRSALKEIFPEG